MTSVTILEAREHGHAGTDLRHYECALRFFC